MHRLENMERLEPLLATHADQLGYVRVTRLMALDNATGNRERPLTRVDWTDSEMERLKLPPTAAERPVIVNRYIYEQITGDTRPGERNKFRVRGYAPSAANSLFDITIHCHGVDRDAELTVVQPLTLVDQLKTEGLGAASEVIELVLQASKRVTAGSADIHDRVIKQVLDASDRAMALQRESQAAVIDFYKLELERAHEKLADKDKLIARLSERSMHRDREELERSIERIQEERTELAEKARQGDAMDRLERIGSTLFGIKDLTPQARELLPLLGQTDIVGFLTDPNIAAVLQKPDQRRVFLDQLREAMATTAEGADTDTDDTEPEEEDA